MNPYYTDEFDSVAFDARNRARRVRLKLIPRVNQTYQQYNGRLKYCSYCQEFFIVLDQRALKLRIVCPFCHKPLRNRARKKTFKWEKAINPEAILA